MMGACCRWRVQFLQLNCHPDIYSPSRILLVPSILDYLLSYSLHVSTDTKLKGHHGWDEVKTAGPAGIKIQFHYVRCFLTNLPVRVALVACNFIFEKLNCLWCLWPRCYKWVGDPWIEQDFWLEWAPTYWECGLLGWFWCQRNMETLPIWTPTCGGRRPLHW